MKKIFITFLTFVLYFNSFTSAHAQTVGGWSVGGGIAQGASTVYNGTRKILIGGKEFIQKGSAKITPNASQVAKVLGRGVAGYALSVAVQEMLGAVDWVLDPANNRIKYFDPTSCTSNGSACPHAQKYYQCYSRGMATCANYFDNPQSACNDVLTKNSVGAVSVTLTGTMCRGYNKDGKLVYDGYLNTIINPAYDQTAEREQKYLPLETVAQKVIDNAQNNDREAQVATTAAAADVMKDAENDNVKARPIADQFEQSSTTENADADAQANSNTSTGEAKPNAETGTTDLALQFPVFCNWTPTICRAADVVINFPNKLEDWYNESVKSISDAYTAIKEWATTEKDKNQDDTEIEILDDAVPNLDKGLFQASGQCPPDFSYAFPLPLGGSYNITYSYSTACNWFSKIYYVVILVASIIGLKIVTGADGNKDG